ncbi:MAG: hypothetical protein FJ290_23380 [Planctomycetes bacterium]|nr:hypothetical protein [Planctomycetota bacterium]
MKGKEKSPTSGPLGAVLKFVFAALFGGLISLVISVIVYWTGAHEFWRSGWVHTLWIIPLVWGVLGIVWFDEMLDWAREFFEGFSESAGSWRGGRRG